MSKNTTKTKNKTAKAKEVHNSMAPITQAPSLVLVPSSKRKFVVEVDSSDEHKCSLLEHYLKNHEYQFVMRGGKHGQKVKDEDLRNTEKEYCELSLDLRFKMNKEESTAFRDGKSRIEIIQERIEKLKAAQNQEVAA